MNSPPPSDGILPSSQLSDDKPYIPVQENLQNARQSRREKRKAVLTPRKFARFFTPRSQITTAQPSLGQPALAPLSDASLNARPSSPQAPPLDHENCLVSPSSSPIRHVKKRKLTSAASSSEAGPSSTHLAHTESIPARRAVTFSARISEASAQYASSNDESDHLLSSPAQQRSVRITSVSKGRQSVDEEAAPEASGSTPSARVLFPRATRQSNHAESGTELLKFFRTQRPRSQEQKPDKMAARIAQPTQPVKMTLNVPNYNPTSFVKLENRGSDASLLLREMGLTSRPGRYHPRSVVVEPFHATSKFFSRSTDWNYCTIAAQGPAPQAERTVIPFSVVCSRRTPVAAIGDEEGCIRIFATHSQPADVSDRSKTSPAIHYHDNAIMDMDISEDDRRIATACGDRSGKIIDPATQQVQIELGNGHDHAMRRVRFQPGQANGNVLSTCDKVGRIQIWDLRVSGTPADVIRDVDGTVLLEVVTAGIINTMDPAHTRTVRGRSNGASVTALQWLTGREHILMSASEADARIKVWDTRYVNRRKDACALPLSSTEAPASHAWRDFGITSMALGGDGSRLYAVCRDSTVYAYSTAHMVLGTDPVLSTRPPRQRVGQDGTGLGPLYGFRHDDLDVRSFYVRCAVRTPEQGHGPELLAVGSSRGCAVLFPTDEAPIRATWDRESRLRHAAPASVVRSYVEPPVLPAPSHDDDDPYSTGTPRRPPTYRDRSGALPIVHNGTALKGGHQREVTGVSWGCDGKLVTISDDMTFRHWQETPTENHTATLDVPRDARDLRVDRNPMKSHYAGWARVPRRWDVDDGMD